MLHKKRILYVQHASAAVYYELTLIDWKAFEKICDSRRKLSLNQFKAVPTRTRIESYN